MNVEIHWLGVFLAAVSSMAVGSIWYAKGVFGAKWQNLVGLKDEQMKKGAAKALAWTFVMSLLTAYILAHFVELSHSFYHYSYVQTGLTTAFWAWLGLVFTRVVTHDLFEQRKMALTTLTISNELVTLLAMGLVIGLVR
ncbi:MAG TPA: DUF1761 domain-containing protein [Candidatus Saccharimonadales bacterium]|nr:DUF1761 domain-containing protein [Candidatus Saccharimonadales bacterium]